jgi:ketosteroid isomerase-like protein
VSIDGDTEAMGLRDPMDVVREVNHAWATRPFERTRDALLASSDWDDAVRRFEEEGLPTDPIDPDVEVVLDAFPDVPGLIGQTGRDGWIRFWQQWVEPWKDFSLEVLDQEQIGDYVVAEVHTSAHTRDGAGELEITVVQLFKIRDGLIVMYGVYPNRDDALAAIRAE